MVFNVAVIHDIVVYAVVYSYGISVKICDQLRTVENLLHIVFCAVQLLVADTVYRQGIASVPDNFGGVLDEHLRVIQKVLPSSALLQDFRYHAAPRQRLPVKYSKDIRQRRIAVRKFSHFHAALGVGYAGIVNLNISRLCHNPRFRDRLHALQGGDAAAYQFSFVYLDAVGGLLLYLVPQLQKLWRNGNFFFQPYGHVAGSVPDRRLCVGSAYGGHKLRPGILKLRRQVQRTVPHGGFHAVFDLAGFRDIAPVFKMGHKLLCVVIGQGVLNDNGFLSRKLCHCRGGDISFAGDHLNGFLFRRFQFFRQFGDRFRHGRVGFKKSLAGKVRKKRFCLLLCKRCFLRPDFLKYHAAEQVKLQNTELHARLFLNLFLQRVGKLRKALICHNVQQIDIPVLDPFPVLVDA